MVRSMLISLFLLSASLLFGQKVDAFAKVSASKKEVYVEQGLKVTVTAFSSTWFAEPLSFENLRIEGAFVQSFRRTQSSIKYLDKKKYAALEFHYIVFPYRTGELVFPELIIRTSIPPEGNYKGQPTTLKTKSFSIFVKEIPNEIEKGNWLVASNVNIKNSWSGNLNEIKVGEVIKRQIIIEANGTLPSFIDEVELKPVDFASIYPHQPEFIDERDNQSVNGKRIDTYSYLFEKEGRFKIPEITIQWYHPVAGKLYQKTIPAFEVIVLPNTELASMQQLKDSLQALNPDLQQTREESVTDSHQINIYIRYAVIIIILIAVLYFTISLVIRLRKKWLKHREVYRKSEAYLYQIMMREKNNTLFLRKLYSWLHFTRLAPDKKTIKELSKNNESFSEESENFKSQFYQPNNHQHLDGSGLKEHIKSWKKQEKQKIKTKNLKYRLKELNPK